MTDATRQYVLLPRRGVFAAAGPAYELLTALPDVRGIENAEPAQLGGREGRVLDTVREAGPKLVELDEAAAAAVNQPTSPVRAEPVVEYPRPDEWMLPLQADLNGGAAAAGPGELVVTCLDASTGKGVPDVQVVAFTNLATRTGASGTTDSAGEVRLQVSASMIERLSASAPLGGYWGVQAASLATAAPVTVKLPPVDLGYVDCVRSYYAGSRFDPSTGVIVGVIDTGADPHSGVNVVGGRNTVTGEPLADISDSSVHGTHVTGLVGAAGSPPSGLRGLAPGVPIYVYRVFPPGGGATNYAILKALIFAAEDGCDIVNLSIGGGPRDAVVEEAILDARNQGMLVVISAGNDYRKPVSYPAAYAGATAVSAVGRRARFRRASRRRHGSSGRRRAPSTRRSSSPPSPTSAPRSQPARRVWRRCRRCRAGGSAR